MSQYQKKGATSIISLTDPKAVAYTEINDMAAWGSVVLVASQAGPSTVSCQTGPANTVFGTFMKTGSLDGDTPSFATGNWIAVGHDIHKVSLAPTSVSYAVDQYRDRLVSYLGNDQVGFFKSRYSSVLDTVDGFLNDYQSACTESQMLDNATVD